MMNRPYKRACDTPLARDPPFLVKKLTVNGTIGNIQGIMKAAKPPNSPAIKIPQSDCCLVSLASTCCAGASVARLSSVSLAVPSSKMRSSGISTSVSSSVSIAPSVNSTSSNETRLSCCAKDELYKVNMKICRITKYLNNECITYFDNSLK